MIRGLRPRVLATATTMVLAAASSTCETDLYDPAAREDNYGSNLAQYLIDLHDSKVGVR